MKKLLVAAVFALPAMTTMAAPAKAPLCAACHGADGIATIPGYPNLAGQNEQYLISSINAYKNKERNGGNAAIMQAQAMNLSDAEIAELAKHYAAMK